jgi:hypothetical protein
MVRLSGAFFEICDVAQKPQAQRRVSTVRSRAWTRGATHVATTGLFAAILGLGAVGAASAAADPVVSAAGQSPAAVRAYWTQKRMRAAEPLSVLQKGPLDIIGAPAASPAKASGKAALQGRPRAYPNRTNGKVFMTIPSGADMGDYECSGTAVTAPSRSLVWTAGHCGFAYPEDPFPASMADCDCFVTNFEFVPAYDNGAKPFGEWPAKSGGLATTSQWKQSGNSAFDFTAATVARRNGRRLEDVVGGRRIAFGQPRRVQYKAYGYPAEPPFDGQHQYRCTSGYRGSDGSEGPPSPIRIACDMTPGSSGGGWVIKRPYRHHFRHYLVAVTSYGYVFDPGFLYGPYQGGVARALYNSAGG